MRGKSGGRLAVAATSMALAATLALPPAPAGAATAESCHEPEQIEYCLCVMVARIGQALLPGTQWSCSRP